MNLLPLGLRVLLLYDISSLDSSPSKSYYIFFAHYHFIKGSQYFGAFMLFNMHILSFCFRGTSNVQAAKSPLCDAFLLLLKYDW